MYSKDGVSQWEEMARRQIGMECTETQSLHAFPPGTVITQIKVKANVSVLHDVPRLYLKTLFHTEQCYCVFQKGIFEIFSYFPVFRCVFMEFGALIMRSCCIFNLLFTILALEVVWICTFVVTKDDCNMWCCIHYIESRIGIVELNNLWGSVD